MSIQVFHHMNGCCYFCVLIKSKQILTLLYIHIFDSWVNVHVQLLVDCSSQACNVRQSNDWTDC